MKLTRVIQYVVLLSVLFSLLFLPSVHAQDPKNRFSPPLVILTNDQGKYPLGFDLEYLEDRDGHLTLEDVQSAEHATRFVRSQDYTPNFGFTGSAYWVRFRIQNTTQIANHWLLEVGSSFTDLIDIYFPQENGQFVHKQVGDSFPFSVREVKHPRFVFNVSIPSHTESIYYLRFFNKGRVTIELTLWNALSFATGQLPYYLQVGLFGGAMLIMMGYNGILFLLLREKTYLYYTLFIVGTGIMLFTAEGFTFQLVWPKAIWWNDVAVYTFSGLAEIFALLFSDQFLHLKTNSPQLHRVMMGVTAFWSLLTALLTVTPTLFLLRLIVAISMPLPLFLAGIGVFIWRRGYHPAKYYLFSWGLLFIGFFIELLGFTGSIPLTFIQGRGLEIGVVVAFIFFSLAISERMNVLKHEKAEAQTKALKAVEENARLIREQNLILEQKVMERTAELQYLNATKDKFFSIIAHDLRSPFTTLLGLAQLLSTDFELFSPEKRQEYINKIYTAGKRLHALLENLLTWARHQLDGIQYEPKLFDIVKIAEENVNLFMAMAEDKQITLTQHIPGQTIVYADPRMVDAVIRNLLSNALKFTGPGGHVEISVSVHDIVVEVAISDTGPGISLENFDKLFRLDAKYTRPGTEGERGTGLGLILCQEFIRQNKGEIWGESEPGIGSTFRFTLPQTP